MYNRQQNLLRSTKKENVLKSIKAEFKIICYPSELITNLKKFI